MLNRHQELEDLKQRVKQESALRNKSAFFDPGSRSSRPGGRQTQLVEFYDCDCPIAALPCSSPEILSGASTTTRFAFAVEFPIESLHLASGAMFAARASLAARRQPERYMDFHFALLAEEGQMSEDMVYANAAKVEVG